MCRVDGFNCGVGIGGVTSTSTRTSWSATRERRRLPDMYGLQRLRRGATRCLGAATDSQLPCRGWNSGQGRGDKRMRLRYAGTCRVCGIALAEKTEAIDERSAKTVRCLVHDGGATNRPPRRKSSRRVRRGHRRAASSRGVRPSGKGAFEPGTRSSAGSSCSSLDQGLGYGGRGEERLGNRLRARVGRTAPAP